MNGNPIYDSSAVSFPNKVLAQHHAAINLLTKMLEARNTGELVDWLDLGCGRGQIIYHLNDTIPDNGLRAKIRYFGYDVKHEYTQEALKIAASHKLGDAKVLVGQLDHFADIVKPTETFSFGTFVNVVHELPPVLFGSLLLELILRMNSDAKLYIYDMETLAEPELGAIPWDAHDVKQLLTFIFKELGARTSPPQVPRWQHTTCSAWSVDFDRTRLDIDTKTITQKLPELKEKTKAFVSTLFTEKLKQTISALEEISMHGGQVPKEQKDKINLLFKYWSLSRLKY